MICSQGHTSRSTRRLIAALTAAGAVATGTVAFLPAAPAEAATCSDIEVDFARGSGELPGLGILGQPLVTDLSGDLSGRSVTSYAVDYAADLAQTSAGAGSTDLVNHISQVAAACSNTRFVVGGYSQGATVVDKALGLFTFSGGIGSALPAALAPRVAAVVVFGNPLGLQRQTIEASSPTYGARTKSYCNLGDPVCGNGFDFFAHLTYSSNGSVPDAASFAAGKVTALG